MARPGHLVGDRLGVPAGLLGLLLHVSSDELLTAFSPSQAYTVEAANSAPTSSGVHVVLERGVVVYVGWTGNLRRRLRQHLAGNRGSSVLHDQVGHMLDSPDRPASAHDIAEWLGHCMVSWRQTNDPKALKESLAEALTPRFNRQIPKPRR